jgi:hypothetical protein
MRVVALMSWYQESPVWLAASVAAAAKACDHVVAVDGAYFLFPGGRPRSGSEQAAVIQEVAHAHGMGSTVHTPDTTWEGNEVEKRAAMFRLAETVTDEDDWYFVIDADVVVDAVPDDFRSRLSDTDCDTAEVGFWERDDVFADPAKAAAARSMDWPTSEFPVRALYRAVRGLTVVDNHYTYVTPDGRTMWGNRPHELEPALDMTDLRCEHRTNFRDLSRRNMARDYYKRRDALGIESDTCGFCGRRGSHVIPYDWQPDGDALSATSVAVCDDCLPDAKRRSDDQVRALGRDPAGLEYEGPTS